MMGADRYERVTWMTGNDYMLNASVADLNVD